MATIIWTGDASPTAKVVEVTFTDIQAGKPLGLSLNGKEILVTPTSTSLTSLVTQFVTAIEAAQDSGNYPEWEDVTAALVTNEDGVTRALQLTGPEDGKDFTVTGTNATTGDYRVEISRIQGGAGGYNQVDAIDIHPTVSGGTFTLSIEGSTTSAIAYNAAAATVEAAIEAITGAGTATTTGSAPNWTVLWTGSRAQQAVETLEANGASLTVTPTMDVQIVQDGGVLDEVWTLTRNGLATSDEFSITLNSPDGEATVGPVSATISAADLLTAIEATTPFQTGDVDVTGNDGGPWTIRWIGRFGETAIPETALVVANTWIDGVLQNGGYGLDAAQVDIGGTRVNEIQRWNLETRPISGTYTVTIDGQTTGNFTFNSTTEAQAETLLEALSNVTSATVTRESLYVMLVELAGPLGGESFGKASMTPGSLAGSRPSIYRQQEAVLEKDEVQRVYLSGRPQGGTFTLTQDFGSGDETTSGIAYNASAATVEAALIALTTPVSGDFIVTGADGGPWLVQYTQNLGAKATDLMTGSAASLTAGSAATAPTVTTMISPTGPNWADNPANYSGGAVPVNSDTLIFEDSEVSLLYGLDQLSSVTLAELIVRMSYTGQIGLAPHNGDYYEYLPTYLQIGATLLTIGQGEGTGSSRLRINTGSVATTVLVLNTGDSADDNPTFVWKGTSASNVFRVVRGSVGIAIAGGEAANVSGGLHVGFVDDQENDASLEVGTGVTVSGVTQTGGVIVAYAGAGTINQLGGTASWEKAVTRANVDGGEFRYGGSATLGTLDVGSSGRASFDHDLRGPTVTNCYLRAGAELSDLNGVVTWTNPIQLQRCRISDVVLDLGANISLDPAAL